MNTRKAFDLDAYIERIQNNPCFICEIAAGRLNGNHVIYRDEEYIAFLNKYPTLYGYVLVAPVQHKEQATGDFSPDEYLSRVAVKKGPRRMAFVPRTTRCSARRPTRMAQVPLAWFCRVH